VQDWLVLNACPIQQDIPLVDLYPAIPFPLKK
jgi:hypothetical protein